jgi:hypothetical protein
VIGARHYSLILLLAILLAAAVPTHAQVIPDPNRGYQLYIRNIAGRVVERLQPVGDRYDLYDLKRQFTPIGYAKILGRRLIIYNMNNHPIASVRAELLPPDSSLAAISIVRDNHGQAIGVLEHY